MILLGLDPGLRVTGWGVIEAVGNRLRHVADGVIRSDAERPLAERLVQLHEGVMDVMDRHSPDEAAV
ncbi:MAG: crossover junction endodeoxyribonuclease RuvC, partial [Alphaproteobacteria bacterium]|nr:crossover junction endodeoxyribonuclease RuvC [Alphaproteobacteria bacterium]